MLWPIPPPPNPASAFPLNASARSSTGPTLKRASAVTARDWNRVSAEASQPRWPDGDLAGIVGGTPREPHPRLQVGATAPLGRVGLGVEEPLRRAGRRGQHGDLLGQPKGVSLLQGGPELRQPQPQVAGGGEIRETDGGEGARAPLRDERRLLAEQELSVRPRD